MRVFVLILALVATAPASAFTVAESYKADFDAARECSEIDGRKVWKGAEAFYIQSWLFQTGQSGVVDDENVSVIAFADNDRAALVAFEAACE